MHGDRGGQTCRVRKSRHAARTYLVNDTAESITTHNASVTGCRHRGTADWPPVAGATARDVAGARLMIDESLQDPFQVLLVENQQPVETL